MTLKITAQKFSSERKKEKELLDFSLKIHLYIAQVYLPANLQIIK